VLLVVLACVAGAAAQNSFCERYTEALWPGQGLNATWQKALVNSVVTCAFGGTGIGACGSFNAVTGLYYEPNNAPYFNGTLSPMIDYLAAGSGTLLTTLVDHLDRFFMGALN